jgi:hypothetical protein
VKSWVQGDKFIGLIRQVEDNFVSPYRSHNVDPFPFQIFFRKRLTSPISAPSSVFGKLDVSSRQVNFLFLVGRGFK